MTKFERLLDYCIQHQQVIFVRACLQGKWGSYALTELPFKLAMEHILRWNEENVIPARMLTEAELKKKVQENMPNVR